MYLCNENPDALAGCYLAESSHLLIYLQACRGYRWYKSISTTGREGWNLFFKILPYNSGTNNFYYLFIYLFTGFTL